MEIKEKKEKKKDKKNKKSRKHQENEDEQNYSDLMRVSEREIHFQKSYSIYEGGIQNPLVPQLEDRLEKEEKNVQFNDQIDEFNHHKGYDQDSNQIDSFSRTKNHADQQKEAFQMMN